MAPSAPAQGPASRLPRVRGASTAPPADAVKDTTSLVNRLLRKPSSGIVRNEAKRDATSRRPRGSADPPSAEPKPRQRTVNTLASLTTRPNGSAVSLPRERKTSAPVTSASPARARKASAIDLTAPHQPLRARKASATPRIVAPSTSIVPTLERVPSSSSLRRAPSALSGVSEGSVSAIPRLRQAGKGSTAPIEATRSPVRPPPQAPTSAQATPRQRQVSATSSVWSKATESPEISLSVAPRASQPSTSAPTTRRTSARQQAAAAAAAEPVRKADAPAPRRSSRLQAMQAQQSSAPSSAASAPSRRLPKQSADLEELLRATASLDIADTSVAGGASTELSREDMSILLASQFDSPTRPGAIDSSPMPELPMLLLSPDQRNVPVRSAKSSAAASQLRSPQLRSSTQARSRTSSREPLRERSRALDPTMPAPVSDGVLAMALAESEEAVRILEARFAADRRMRVTAAVRAERDRVREDQQVVEVLRSHLDVFRSLLEPWTAGSPSSNVL